MSKLKCTGCKDRFDKESMQRLPAGNFHTIECALEYANNKTKKRNKAIAVKAKKADRKQHKADKERVKKRYGKNGYYDNLKTELHRYIKHVLRKGEPCYTCGKNQSFSDSPQAFHVGHFIPSKGYDCRRFMHDWLRIQCYSCNVANSGKRAEYRINLINEVGLDKVEWFECDANHLELNEQYHDVSDIKKETARYRRLANQK